MECSRDREIRDGITSSSLETGQQDADARKVGERPSQLTSLHLTSLKRDGGKAGKDSR